MRKIRKLFNLIIIFTSLLACTKDKVPENKLGTTDINPQSMTELCNNSNAGNCPGIPYVRETMWVKILPEYPNCEFQVIFDKRECPNGIDVKILEDIASRNLVPAGNECLDWTDDFNQAVFNNTVEEFLQKYYKNLVKALTIQLGGTHYCNTGNPAKLIGYSDADCLRTIIYRQDGSGAITRRIPCGSGCCATTYSYCIDPVTNVPVVTQIGQTSSTNMSCVWNGPPIVFPPGTVYWGFCSPQCQNYNN